MVDQSGLFNQGSKKKKKTELYILTLGTMTSPELTTSLGVD